MIAKSLTFITIVVTFLAVSARAVSDVVTVTGGKVKGYFYNDVMIYRDIPFAAPPVGDYRWQAPKPVIPWKDILDGSVHRSICPQFQMGETGYIGDEDCLFLSVYAPADAKPGEKLPVFFWIYGGGWKFGDNFEFGLYDAVNIVKKHRYIVVAPNYRLGSLGFLTHEDTLKEGSAGNYGLLDQRAALEWARDNVAVFGGNPKQVTIAGESAGAFSVCFHIGSEKSAGLFHKAIMESGTCDSPFFFAPQKEQAAFGKQFAINKGCPDNGKQLSCLRKLPVYSLLKDDEDDTHRGDPYPRLYPSFAFTATINNRADGLKDTPFNLMRKGKHNNVPLLAGSNLDEGTLFIKILTSIIPGFTQPFTEQSVNEGLAYVFGAEAAKKINSVYQPGSSDFKNPDDRLAKVLRDYFFVCSSRRVQEILSKAGQKTYLYQFTHKPNWIDFAILGVYHISELYFVFDNAFPAAIHKFDTNDRYVADMMGSYWANFVKNGNPSVGEAVPVVWNNYDSKAKSYIELNAKPHAGNALLESKCIFWDLFQYGEVF